MLKQKRHSFYFNKLHPDMQALLKKMGVSGLAGSPGNGHWYWLDKNVVFIGWISWPTTETLIEAIHEVYSLNKNVTHIMTFAKMAEIKNESIFITNFSNVEMIHGIVDLQNISNEMHPDIRSFNHVDVLKKIKHHIQINGDLKFEAEHEISFLKALNSKPFIFALEKEHQLHGSIIFHGVTQDTGWLRRLFVIPSSRDRGFAPILMNSTLAFARRNNFKYASGLIEKKLWDRGIYKSLGFEEHARVRLLKIFRKE